MAGSRHHVIPQFMLRGFASHAKGEAVYTWVHRKGSTPFNPNVLNVAVESEFYTNDGSSEVDDLVTAGEGDFGLTVHRLRTTGDLASVAATDVARLIAHLEVRTRHLRTNFEAMATSILGQVLAFVEDEVKLTGFILREMKKDPDLLAREAEKDLREKGIPAKKAAQLVRSLRPQMDRIVRLKMPEAVRGIGVNFRRFVTERPDGVRPNVRAAQLRALKNDIAPKAKVALYSDMEYTLLRMPEKNLPLGDSVVVAHVDSPRKYKSFVSSDDPLIGIYLPIAPGLAVCGRPRGVGVASIDLPFAVAQCANELFVSHRRGGDFDALHQRIGERSVLYSDAEIGEILSDTFGHGFVDGGDVTP